MPPRFRSTPPLAAALALAAACADPATAPVRPAPDAAPRLALTPQSPTAPVVNSTDDVTDATGCTPAHCSLREAIAFATAGATVTFDAALDGQQIMLAQRGDGDRHLLITKSLTLDASALGGGVTLRGNGAYGVLVVRGGGVRVVGRRLTVTGGGNVQFGGGIIIAQGADVRLDETVVAGNAARTGRTFAHVGGGIAIFAGSLELIRSTVRGNDSQDDGGGIYASAVARLLMVNSTVSGNHARNGGGIFTLSDPEDGQSTNADLVGSTLYDNTAHEAGAQIFQDEDYGVGGGIRLTGVVIGRSTSAGPSDCRLGSTRNSFTASVARDASCGLPPRGDLKLGSLAANGGPTPTHALLVGSPALDAGTCAATVFGTPVVLATDQRGILRPQGARCDAGAFEREQDVAAPVLMLPAPFAVNATSPAGATVAYVASALDAVDGPVPVTCTPKSGSVFAIGTTTVACSATDLSTNMASGSFAVTVRGAAVQLDLLVARASATSGMSTGTLNKLRDAQAHVAAGRTRAACSALADFIADVRDQSGRRIAVDAAAVLIADATRIRAVIGCA